MLRNYLDLPEIYTQLYFNQYTILLLLILIKLIILRNSLINAISKQLIDDSVCDENNIQQVLNAVHRTIMDGVDKLKYSGIVSIVLIIKTIRVLTVFFIDLFLGTYICLLRALVKGTTEFAFDATESVIQAVNVTIVEATNQIEEGLQGLSKFINDLGTGVDAISQIFTGGGGDTSNANQYEDKINLTLGNLKNKIMIPGSVLTEIEQAKNVSMKELNDLNNHTQTLIETPFNVIIKNLDAIKFTNSSSNSSINPLNVKGTCMEAVNVVKDSQNVLVKTVEITSQWLFIALACIILVSLLYVLYTESCHWKRETRFIMEKDLDAGEVGFRNQQNIYNNPVLYIVVKRCGIQLNERSIWILSYMSSRLANIVLIFGLMGIISVILQVLLIHFLKQSINGEITKMDSGTNNSATSKVVVSYIASMNNYMNTTEANLNSELFGEIKSTSIKINSTISEFLDNLSTAIQSIFGTTVLASALDTIVYCTIGRKLEKVEEGCTWLVDNLQIQIPSIPPDVQKSIESVSFMQPQSIMSKLNSMIAVYKDSIRLELIISLAFIAAWLLQLIIGLVILYTRQRKDAQFTPFGTKKALKIGCPQPLNEKEKQLYEYPLSEPPAGGYVQTSSSYYPSPP
ncbi:PRM1 [Candida oxycetoniae]|uniref:Plasma membrane fusion protein PRM1 n=1 Tax=Candida oxycetoniae TaxID=497107 RepID=A0AAI9SZS4_9ASCO|nr:PRM1 [Candida oxycetoniae]KAI3405792.2 PRM1 [Candida oxycetoniae]